MAIINYDDYNLRSFLEGSARSQPVPFKVETPMTGAPFIVPCNDSIEDLPVAWDVSMIMTDAEAERFKQFIDDLFLQPERKFTKAMVTEYGNNVETLTITSGRPQPVKIAFNAWAVDFSLYSESISRVQSELPELPEFGKPVDGDLVPSEWHELTPRYLNSGASSLDGRAPFYVDSIGARSGSPIAIISYAYGYFARSEDSMRTWSDLPLYLGSPIDVGSASNGAFDICMSSNGEHIFAAMVNGRSAKSDNFGLTWTPLGQGLNGYASFPTASINAAAMSADGNKIAACIGFEVGISNDGGTTWTMVSQGLSGINAGFIFFKSMAMSDDGSKIIIGHNSGCVSMSNDGGASWSALPVGLGTSHTGNCLDCAMSQNGKVILMLIGNGGAYSKDGGTTWIELPEWIYTGSPNPDTTDFMAACSMSTSGQKMLVTTREGYAAYSEDVGSTWVMLIRGLDKPTPEGDFTEVLANSGDVWISGGPSGHTSVSGFIPEYIPEIPPGRAPTNWSNNPPRFLNSGAASAGNAYTCIDRAGSTIFYGSTAGYASRSQDFGVTFAAMVRGLNSGTTDIANTHVLAMACSEDGQIIVVGFSNGWISRSLDGGDTWSAITRGANTGSLNNITTISMSANGQVIFVGNNGGYASISYNGGSTFSTLPRNLSSGSTSSIMLSSAMSSDGQTIYAGFYQGWMSRSLDGGMTWNAIPRGAGIGTTTSDISSIAISKDGQKIYVGTGSGQLKYSTNSAGSWALATPDGLNSGATGQTIYSVACSYDGSVLAVMSGNGYAAYSADSAATWFGLTRGLNTTFFLPFTSLATNGQVWFTVQNGGRAAISLPV